MITSDSMITGRLSCLLLVLPSSSSKTVFNGSLCLNNAALWALLLNLVWHLAAHWPISQNLLFSPITPFILLKSVHSGFSRVSTESLSSMSLQVQLAGLALRRRIKMSSTRTHTSLCLTHLTILQCVLQCFQLVLLLHVLKWLINAIAMSVEQVEGHKFGNLLVRSQLNLASATPSMTHTNLPHNNQVNWS